MTEFYPCKEPVSISDCQYLTSGSPPRVNIRVTVLLQQLLFVHTENVHAIGVERQQQIVRQVGQEVRDALHLETVEEMASVPVRRDIQRTKDRNKQHDKR